MLEEKFESYTPEFLFGKWLANSPKGEEVVITGLSGKFPKSENMFEFTENLFNKTDMFSNSKERWELGDPNLPPRIGITNDIDVLDTGFFGVHPQHAEIMCPDYRMFLERAIEAIFDAGLHPRDLEGSRTNVYVCASFCDHNPSSAALRDNPFAIRMHCRTFAAQTISHVLKLEGTSFHMDSACSSSLSAVEDAYRNIRMGKCDNALITGSIMVLDPYFTCGFTKLGILSPDGILRAMDEDGNGYVRSESAVAIVIQKANNARRIYSEIVHCKVNQDGYKEDGITHPSHEDQTKLCNELYGECGINPSDVSYVEAHATGTRVGDLVELTSINDVFCSKREKPLLVGSVKSNMGHTEGCSGLTSISKVIVGMKYGYIPPNVNFRRLRKEIESIANGKIRVVTEKIPWQDDYPLVGINNFGFGGSNAHVLLRGYKANKASPPVGNLPRLVCYSGRTEKALNLFKDEIRKNQLNYEFLGFINMIFKYDLPTHRFRGFCIVSKTGIERESINFLNTLNRKLVLYFNNFDERWLKYGRDLLAVPLFSRIIQRIDNILSAKGMNITGFIVDYEKLNQESPLIVFLACFSIQLAIADMLKWLDIKSDYTQGCSTGHLIKNYFNGDLTLQQVVLIAHSYVSLLEISKSDNARKELKSGNPKSGIVQNGDENRSYANRGSDLDLEAAVKNFLVQLQEILSYSVKNKENLPKNSKEKKITVESIAQNLLTLKEVDQLFHFDSVMLEVGFGKNENERFSHIHFNSSNDKNGVVMFSEVLGKLYLAGHNYSIENLYPKMSGPVSNDTPFVSPLIGWNHSKKMLKPTYGKVETKTRQERIVRVEESEWSFLKGHVIDGSNVFPETGYLYLVWEAVSAVKNLNMFAATVTFENVEFIRATNISENGALKFVTMLYKGTSKFELFEGDTLIAQGKVHLTTENETEILVTNDLELNMKDSDIYKELKLRGYHYSGLFRSIRQCNLDATVGAVQWQNNWVAFLDNLLQMQMLQKYTRNLYVPNRLRKFTINPASHLKFIEECKQEGPMLPITLNPATLFIKCGSIEIEGLETKAISKVKPLVEPVLEKCVFIPNKATLKLQESVRINMQIALENNWLANVVVYELIDDETRDDVESLSPFILAALEDQPLIRWNITILTKKQIDITKNINVENRSLTPGSECFLIVATNMSGRKQLFQQSLRIVKDCFIISRESLDSVTTTAFDGAEILTIHSTEKEKLILLHKTTQIKEQTLVKVTNTFECLSKLKSAYSEEKNIILYSKDDPTNGILGLTNCLRREPNGKRIKCFFIDDRTAPNFQVTSDFYQKQIKTGLAINVYKDGTWGTYRQLLLEELESTESEHVHADVKTLGDLSSLKWFEGPLKVNDVVEPENTMIKIYYAAVNFRDVMEITGKLHPELSESKRIKQNCGAGFEFAGMDLNGSRVMGVTTAGAMANLAVVNNSFIYPIPDHWSMEEASTVVAAYITVLYALLKRVPIKRGQSILIHSGAGGVGQAAINVCLHFGLKIFTTVGTQEKREFIRNQYPQITDNQIGNSRDTSFEQMVLKRTHGRGVDYVLNSPSKEKLVASIRCVAKGGHLIELGKTDMVNDGSLRTELFAKSSSFHSVMVDSFFERDSFTQKVLRDLLMRGIEEGYVKPLKSTVFEPDQVESAFTYLVSGRNIGKIVLRVRNYEDNSPKNFKGTPRYFCSSTQSYIITGGLGGFGLELADWLVFRGARKLVLLSHTGINTGYQAFRIKLWESYGVEVKISTSNIKTKEGCARLIQEASEMGPVRGIFHLESIETNATAENETYESVIAVKHLDEISRMGCPHLKDFVVFPSVIICSRSIAGQRNYGMAKSVMERICELRHEAGLPAVAIQWGAISDIDEDMILEMGGTLQQSVASCLTQLDTLLKQRNPVLSSVAVAEKKCTSRSDDIIQTIANVIGIKDLKMVSPHSPLPELGMDSIMSTEIKRIIEKECQLVLPAAELRSLTFSRLQELFKEGAEVQGILAERRMTDFEEIMDRIGSESFANLPAVLLPSAAKDNKNSEVVIMLPGIEGTAKVLRKLSKGLKFKTICLQYSRNSNQHDVEKLAESLLPEILRAVRSSKSFCLIAHSFGTLVAVHLLIILEARGLRGNAVFIDGSPVLQKTLLLRLYNFESNSTFETDLLCSFMPMSDVISLKDKLLEAPCSKERIDLALSTAPRNLLPSKDYLNQTLREIFCRNRAVVAYAPKAIKINSRVTLCRPKLAVIADIAEDYHLSEILGQTVDVKYFDGDHLTILDNLDFCKFVNYFFGS